MRNNLKNYGNILPLGLWLSLRRSAFLGFRRGSNRTDRRMLYSCCSDAAPSLERDVCPIQTPVQPALPQRREAEIGRRIIGGDFH